MNATSASSALVQDDRRRAPRIAMDASVTISGTGGRSPARAVNASERGLLVQAADIAWIAADADVRVRLDLEGGAAEIPAEVVRVEMERRWVALRFTGPPQRVQTGPRRRVRKSRAAPKAPRPFPEVRAELRSLAALVYEQALMDANAAPVDTLLEWADRLAGELSVDGVGRPADNRAFLHDLVRVSGDADRAGGDPA
ncbi:MAG: PilZ domain-containing protein [Thermoleophilia bacterium]